MVPLTHDFSETVAERIKNDPVFTQALLDEVITLFVNGEADTAQSILCELADATWTKEALFRGLLFYSAT